MIRHRPSAVLRLALACLLVAAGRPAACAWYHVEVVVFRAFGAAGADSERWPTDPGVPAAGGTIRLLDPSDPALAAAPPAPLAPVGTDGAAAAPVEPVPFVRLGPSEWRLTPLARQLERGGRYAVLDHVAWRQPGLAGTGARAIDLGPSPVDVATAAAVPSTPPPLRGWVRLQSRGSVVVEADLLFGNDGVPVRLTESRKVRLGEVHYLDHPLYGVLVQVTAWRTEDELEAAREAPEAVPPPPPAAVAVPGRKPPAPGPATAGPRASAPAPDLPALPRAAPPPPAAD